MKKTCVVLTGAGISADSGISTFRDSGGLWEGHNVEDVATYDGFRKNPQLVIDFYNQRRRELKKVNPNPAHIALKKLEEFYDVYIITQNVDNLHERAGSSNIIHLHGELNKLRSTNDESYIIEYKDDQKITDKDPNGYPLRPHIVWFGESVPMFDKAVEIAKKADIFLIIGTSLNVYPAAGLMHYVNNNTKIYLVDKNPAFISDITIYEGRASIEVPKLVAELIK